MAGLLALAAHGAGRLATLALELRPKVVAQMPSTSPSPERAAPAPAQKAAMSMPQTPMRGSVTLAQGWWGGWRGSDSWRERPSSDTRRGDRSSRERERSRGWDGDFGWESDPEEDRPQSRGTYRTLCVRLCDGFYWPISFATTAEHFDRDRRKCESSCGSPARLYTYRNPGGNPETMQDLSGKPYSRLKTAFAYRTDYNESCKCRSDPWQQEAMDKHRVYALEAAKKKGDKLAAKGQKGQSAKAQKAALMAAQADPAAEETAAPVAEPSRKGKKRQTAKVPDATPADGEATVAQAAEAGLAGNPQPAAGAQTPTANAGSAVLPADETGPQAPQKTATKPPPSRNERMSLGARSGGSAGKASAPPAGIWRNTAENAP